MSLVEIVKFTMISPFFSIVYRGFTMRLYRACISLFENTIVLHGICQPGKGLQDLKSI